MLGLFEYSGKNLKLAYWLFGSAIDPPNDPESNRVVSYSKTNLTSSPLPKVHKD